MKWTGEKEKESGCVLEVQLMDWKWRVKGKGINRIILGFLKVVSFPEIGKT